MGNRIYNHLFILLVFGVLCATPAGKLLSVAGVEFPSWTGIGEQSSLLEGRTYADLPDLSVEAVEDASFQNGFEEYLSDTIPMRDEAVLLNAAVQRCGIAAGAAMFGYRVYPTFYGSGYVYDAASDRLWPTLRPETQEEAESFERSAAVFTAFSERHPDVRMLFYQVDRSLTSSLNPTHALTASSVDTGFLVEHFYDRLGFDVIDGTCSDPTCYDAAYFKTDHHWTVDEAYTCYQRVLGWFLPDESPVELPDKEQWDVPFYGAVSRLALCMTAEPDFIADYPVLLDGIEVFIDGEKASAFALADWPLYDSGAASDELFANRYAEYFHTDYGLIELRNETASSGTLLVVADSYSNNMERFFAANYQRVYVLDLRHAGIALDSFMESHKVDDLLFLMGSTTLTADSVLDALEPAI